MGRHVRPSDQIHLSRFYHQPTDVASAKRRRTMRGKNAWEIPYPETTAEAHDAFQALTVLFGNCEELNFDIRDSDKDTLSIIRITADLLNHTISIIRFLWLDGCGHEKAVDCINVLTLDLDEAARMADIINYFIKVIKQKGGEK